MNSATTKIENPALGKPVAPLLLEIFEQTEGGRLAPADGEKIVSAWNPADPAEAYQRETALYLLRGLAEGTTPPKPHVEYTPRVVRGRIRRHVELFRRCSFGTRHVWLGGDDIENVRMFWRTGEDGRPIWIIPARELAFIFPNCDAAQILRELAAAAMLAPGQDGERLKRFTTWDCRGQQQKLFGVQVVIPGIDPPPNAPPELLDWRPPSRQAGAAGYRDIAGPVTMGEKVAAIAAWEKPEPRRLGRQRAET